MNRLAAFSTRQAGRQAGAGFLAVVLLASCAVGPDFKKPQAPGVLRYTETDLPADTESAAGISGAAQHFASGRKLAANWWELFGSPPLNQLVEQALHKNPDFIAAQAALREARENYYAARGELLPHIDGNLSATREKFNPAAFGETGIPSSIFTLYDASLSVSYTLDIFGGTRRGIENYLAQADYERYLANASYLTLTANVASAAIQEASLKAQVKETQSIIGIEGKQLRVLEQQFQLGGAAKSIVLEQQATVAQEEATLPALEKQLAVQRNQLAILAGQEPGAGGTPTFEMEQLNLPETLPISLPSELVRHRPDIQAAEALLHAANAEIGVATANMLPQISITGSYGSETVHTNRLFGSGTDVWSIGGNLLQPIFRGGELLHLRRAAIAAHDQAAAQYRSAVLTAFKNVGDSLHAIEFDAKTLRAQVAAAQAAKQSLDLTQEQFKDGAITYPQLLDAQRTYSQARIGLIQAQAQRLVDTVALFQALGGGWKDVPVPAPAPTASIPGGPVSAAPAAIQPASKSEK